MADAIFPKVKQRNFNGGTPVDLDTDDIRVMLVKSTYVYDAADEFVADLGAVDNGRSAALTTKTLDASAIFDADDTTLTATDASACNALVIFKHTGADATAVLIAYIDDAVGLPFTPEAAQVCPIVWPAAGNKIFKI